MRDSCHRLTAGFVLIVLAGVYLGGGISPSVAGPLDLPPPARLAEAKQIVQHMIASRQGPYSGIRWFCNDGAVLPPTPYACNTHGGGKQHAVYSPQRERLAELGWSVGTVFDALSFEEINASPRRQRLRELALERYLVDIDDGWVLRQAKNYRGRVQVEGEIKAGKRLLLTLAGDAAWVEDNFLLMREMIRVIPHGEDTDLARSVRRQATQLAEIDPEAQRWRVEIHTSPGPTTAARLRTWLLDRGNVDVVTAGRELADDLDALYGPGGRQARLQGQLLKLNEVVAARQWQAEVSRALGLPGKEKIGQLCSQLATAREILFITLSASGRLVLLDAMQDLESEALLTFGALPTRTALRAELISTSRDLLHCAYGSGLLSAGERRSLSADLDFSGRTELALADYRTAVARLKRAPGWALGSLRFTFAEALNSYTALDSRAARFADDLLRESPLSALGILLKILSRDVDHLSGSVVSIVDREVGNALALNAGVAMGRLRIFETLQSVEDASMSRADIVVLPETIAELSPVAGILTLGEGNALSHVQLLARNFGIPNVAIDQDTVDLLRPLENREVILAVDSRGNVILRHLDPQLRLQLAGDAAPADTLIEVASPDLSASAILPLEQLGRERSGVVIGPKAANLGELNRLFPGRVAPGVAIPFAVYENHLREAGLRQRIVAAFAARAVGALDEAAFAAELAAVREGIIALRLAPATREQLLQVMQRSFGEPGTYGVFVRSDTNVEDLPQFTGAGLNETLPNIVGVEQQLAGVSRVWASVLSPRALAWRSNILADPARIYASVLMMKSVPATKSGVLVTANIIDRSGAGITVSTAWGVGGAVAGESAESLVVRDEGVELVSEAKSPYQRRLRETGGVEWIPAPAGPVLSADEISQLRKLARQAQEKSVPVSDDAGNPRPWDIEFGFVNGDLTLFQIRPLVERGARVADAVVQSLTGGAAASPPASAFVSLLQTPGQAPHEPAQ